MIEFRNVNKIIDGRTILNNLNFTINKGELIVFIGPSGCGKTTTLKMINKLITPTSGQILINGNKIETEDTIQLRRNMGYVIQQTGLFPHMTIKENIGLIPSIQKVPEDKINDKVVELLNLVGLNPDDYMNKYPSELSGGQQQRIGIARALVMNPEVILMDEPFSALDPITRNQLQDEIFNIQQTFKKTIIFVTHDMDEALKLADRICIMNKGSIVQFDTPAEILQNPANDFVREFVGKNRIWAQPELIKVKDIMIKNPVKSSPNRTIIQAIGIMHSNHVDSLLIVNESNHLIGFITLKQIRRNLDRSEKVSDIMERELITVNEEESIVQVLKKIKKEDIGYVPVVDDEFKLTGLITKSSLLTILSNQFLDVEADI
ncbi:MAG TPA: proline/glycine betaine ABC transporter ATP-binding protein [Clostridiaceae bacterium]|nr:proline/glycine betaine ABC transporter ATP-binding protein [Clostridiaceae bacterium]HBG37912.1 proline/glycine betaine ABC transporter ATP-binding protein [Clostridiaceae bacterium]HBN28144.1 proline/glycine betaine ABC transporter ATP-binding protein [Clostridiaceae bacterium]HBX47577.1 proline/glycine betaine ABC transporter ATP-binding protein [Clostridiaceae bacterium]HCL49927.1 proline/glycine betaine ABC transporter ATP-binding protein [Clostridiaceae bacterium]